MKDHFDETYRSGFGVDGNIFKRNQLLYDAELIAEGSEMELATERSKQARRTMEKI